MNLSDRVRANIRHLLEAKGLTYGDLGWSRQYVSNVVNGWSGLSLAHVQEFADALHCDVVCLCVLPETYKVNPDA